MTGLHGGLVGGRGRPAHPVLSGPACSFSLAAGVMEHQCGCCRERRASPRNLTLSCADGSRRAFSYTQVEECGCTGLQCDPRGDLGQGRAEGPPRSQDVRRRWSRGAPALPAA